MGAEQFDHAAAFNLLFDLEKQARRRDGEYTGFDWDRIIDWLLDMRDAGDDVALVRQSPGAPPRYWREGHLLVIDLIYGLLSAGNELSMSLARRRGEDLLNVISHVFEFAAVGSGRRPPVTLAEAGEDGVEYQSHLEVGYPRMIRGRIFHALSALTVMEAEAGVGNGAGGRASPKIKGMFRKLVETEDCQIPMFVVGRTFPAFFRLDPDFGRDALGLVFPKIERRSLYIASWTGHLSRDPIEVMFDTPELRELYRLGLELDPGEERDKPFNVGRHDDYEVGIAKHMAFAFLNFACCELDSGLMARFLEKRNATQHKAFIDFIRRKTYRPKPNVADPKRAGARILQVWDWFLDNHAERDTLMRLGGWMLTNNGLIDPARLARRTLRTLEKTEGKLEWEFALLDSIGDFESADPRLARKIRSLFTSSRSNPILLT